MRFLAIVTSSALLAATGCKESPRPAVAPEKVAAETATTPGSAPTTKDFDPLNIAESNSVLPDFPLFKSLDGLTNNFDDKSANIAFDRDYFIAGKELVPVEGKVFRGEYNLSLDRPYSSLEFRRNYETAIAELGGVKIGGPVSTNEYRIKLQGTTPKPNAHCFIDPCDEADFYLIRQGGKQFWIAVATGSFPLHGYVVVLEKAEMAKSYSFMDADALKAALDAKGRVPIYIEFDVDRASIRPVARPAVDEIVKLMTAHPKLIVSIEGHTDDTGTTARNKPLSLARAEAVRAELIAGGIAPARMRTVGYGSEKPLVQGSDENSRARNRRVELVRL
jgi:outer membrane protein OmpA-like peptidoglycan-associated protein